MELLKTYSVQNDINSQACVATNIHQEIIDSGHVESCDRVHLSGDVLKVYGTSISNEGSLDLVVSAHDGIEDLERLKTNKTNRIDEKTALIINDGFQFNGKGFSLSSNAQTNLVGLYTAKDSPLMSYPVTFNTKDDSDTFDAQNASDIENIYFTALGTKKAAVDSGTTLKDQVRAATTKAEIDAIIDNR